MAQISYIPPLRNSYESGPRSWVNPIPYTTQQAYTRGYNYARQGFEYVKNHPVGSYLIGRQAYKAIQPTPPPRGHFGVSKRRTQYSKRTRPMNTNYNKFKPKYKKKRFY